MMDPKKIAINDFQYELPAARIAMHALEERDSSRLLIYKKGVIQEDNYKNIVTHLPNNSLLIFNNTKVIKARIVVTKPSGGQIEIFLLEPLSGDYTTTLTATKKTTWKCLIGGAGKWKEEYLQVSVNEIVCRAAMKEKLADAFVVEFTWDADISFAEILEQAGDIPLPPYIKRKTSEQDTDRYQTIYAKDAGSVAAPTAGLHFTRAVFDSLPQKNINTAFVTLHVGAGTFKPVKAALMEDHEMHAEWIDVSAAFIEQLLDSMDNPVVVVGTTSLRTVESLYWMGVKVIQQPDIKALNIKQWEVYESPLANSGILPAASLEALLNWMHINNQKNIVTQSQIIIAPGYHFKIADALITNFHQPQSTLLLLVAAAIGSDWRTVYDHALQHDFRFLSYGDGSLLFINSPNS